MVAKNFQRYVISKHYRANISLVLRVRHGWLNSHESGWFCNLKSATKVTNFLVNDVMGSGYIFFPQR